MKIKGKKAVAGEMILTLYRIVLVSIIAVFVLGFASFAYDFYIEARDIEAGILAKQIVDCLAPEGSVNLLSLVGNENKILDYCGFKNMDRIYAKVLILDGAENEIEKLEQGDSGALWMLEIYKEESEAQAKNTPEYGPKYLPDKYGVPKEQTENIKKYVPGHFVSEKYGVYEVAIIDGKNPAYGGELKVEVFVGHEF